MISPAGRARAQTESLEDPRERGAHENDRDRVDDKDDAHDYASIPRVARRIAAAAPRTMAASSRMNRVMESLRGSYSALGVEVADGRGPARSPRRASWGLLGRALTKEPLDRIARSSRM